MPVLLTLFLLGASLSGAQVQTPAAPSPSGDRASVEGTIFNSATGEPLRKASVMLRRALETMPTQGQANAFYTAATDAAGRYSIAGIAPGKYRVMAEHTGFVAQHYGARAPGMNQSGTPLALEPAQNLRGIDLRLTPQGVIAGRVLDEDSDPVANVTVSCMRQAYVRGRKQYVPVESQSTNDLGEYRMFSLAPGRYALMATYRPGGWNDSAAEGSGIQETYAATYYPGVSAPDMANPVEVAAGSQLRGVDIRLQKVRAVRVRGHVASAVHGKSVRNSMVRLVPRSEQALNPMGMRAGRVMDDNGEFVISGVTPGSYWLVAETREPVAMISKVPLEVGSASIDDAVVTMAPAADLSGSVKLAGCEGLKMANVRILLEPREPAQVGAAASNAAVAADDAKFTLKNVSPDAFNVRVLGAPNICYAKSIQFGDAELADSVLDLSQGSKAGELVVTISGGAGQVDGSVEDDKQQVAGSATVVLVPEGSRREQVQFYFTAATGPDGRFAVRGIAPGDYRIYAFDQVEPGAYQDADFMKPFEARGEKAGMRENGHETMQLKLIRTAQP